jgi:hypothetical protein
MTSTSLSPHFKWFFGLLGLEALLASIDLSQLSFIDALSSDLGKVFPVIMNFSGEAKPIHIARNYIALTILFLPAKALFGYIWLQHRRGEALKTVLVSPYSENRSSFAKVVFLVGVYALTLGASWYMLWAFGEESFRNIPKSLVSMRIQYAMVLRNGLSMWISWVLMHMTILGFAWSSLIVTTKDWLAYLGFISKQK